MPPAHILAALFAAALWATVGLATAFAADPPASDPAWPSRAQPAGQQGPPSNQAGNILPLNNDWRQSLASKVSWIGALVEDAYAKAPALVIALSLFLVLPTVALASYLVHTAARRRSRHAAIRAAELRAVSLEASTDMPTGDVAPLWSHGAWLKLEGGTALTLPLAGQTIRIGRHQDNDIRLPDTTVHRHHAVIERTGGEVFIITDLSGEAGNGMRINGERFGCVRLSDGDVIELGRTRLKFESAPA
jgi:hypothetical protein